MDDAELATLQAMERQMLTHVVRSLRFLTAVAKATEDGADYLPDGGGVLTHEDVMAACRALCAFGPTEWWA